MSQYISRSKCANVTIRRKKGDSFAFSFQVSVRNNSTLVESPVNLSSYDFAKMKVKPNEFSSSVLEFTSTGLTNTIDISNLASGMISITGEPLSLAVQHYLFDIELKNIASGYTETVAGGKFIIENEVTF